MRHLTPRVLRTSSPSGFTGGFEIGYNWQLGNGRPRRRRSVVPSAWQRVRTGVYPCCAPSTFTVSSSVNTTWLATLRGRIGLTTDNWLFYAIGGAAFTTLHGNFSFFETFYGAPTEFASLSATRTGYTAGGGVEAAFWQHWSVKAEYLYLNFGTATTSGLYGTGVLVFLLPSAHTIDLKANIVRLDLNYHF